MYTPRKAPRRRNESGGFSLIEVLIALVVLGFGLLGYALLQTMTLRFTQSANYRTQAINLSYDLLDQMRANRHQADWYLAAAFDPGDVTNDECSTRSPPTGTVGINGGIVRWQCQVVRALGDGASAVVTIIGSAPDRQVTVAVAWNDERWKDSDAVTAEELEGAFSLTTRL